MSGTVIHLPSPPRPVEAIRADLAATHARHDAEVRALLAELSNAPERAGVLRAGPAAERRHSKKQAAAHLGLNEARLMRLVVRYHAAHPGRQRLAVQPAGMKNSPWIIYTDRVRSVIDSGEPY